MIDSKTLSFLNNELAKLPPSDAENPFNFIASSLKYLNKWCDANPTYVNSDTGAYCCLVGQERVSSNVRSGFVDRSTFCHDTPQDLLGHVYCCSFALNKVYSAEMVFKNCDECVRWLKREGFVKCPVIIFNAAAREVLWCTSLDVDFQKSELIKNPGKLKSSDFDKALDNFYIKHLATPQGFTKPWLSATKRKTKQDLEETIRDNLYIFLENLMQEKWAVFREVHGTIGRVDLLVLFREEKQSFYLELKVFRQQKTALEIETWGCDGIKQARSYKDSYLENGEAYACCYDGRKDNIEVESLVTLAKRLGIRYRRFFMHDSASSYRAAITIPAIQDSQ